MSLSLYEKGRLNIFTRQGRQPRARLKPPATGPPEAHLVWLK